MKKCKKCGSKDFYLEESMGWKCYIDDDGGMQCKNTDNDIEGIFCDKCGEEYKDYNPNKINFN